METLTFNVEAINAGLLPEAPWLARVQSLLGAAACLETKPEYWIHGWDEGQSFCRECAKKKVAELCAKVPAGEYIVDGGWDTEGDSLAYCESCDCVLENSLTDYGAWYELEHFAESGCDANNPGQAYAMERVLGSQLWFFTTFESDRPYQVEERIERLQMLHAVCTQILFDSIKEMGWARGLDVVSFREALQGTLCGTVEAGGIEHNGRRFQHRALADRNGKQIYFFLHPRSLFGSAAVCCDEDGSFLCVATRLRV